VNYRVTPLDWFLFAGLVVSWGSSFAMSKIALEHAMPEWIAAARLTIGAAVLVASAIAMRRIPSLSQRDVTLYIWLGFFGNAAPFAAITWGMLHISSGIAGLLMGTIPLFTILLSHFTLANEKLTLQRTMGFTLGFIGIVVLIGANSLTAVSFSGNELLGELAVVAGAMMYAVNSVSAKRFSTGGALEQSVGVLIAAAMMSVAYALTQSSFTLLEAPHSALLAILGLGLLPTGFATLIWFVAIARTGPGFTSMSNYLVPIYALIFGALVLDESIGWNAVAALVLILSGIAVTRWSTRQQP
jgi:drug/metabolite transporter (DMT)-like permease